MIVQLFVSIKCNVFFSDLEIAVTSIEVNDDQFLQLNWIKLDLENYDDLLEYGIFYGYQIVILVN